MSEQAQPKVTLVGVIDLGSDISLVTYSVEAKRCLTGAHGQPLIGAQAQPVTFRGQALVGPKNAGLIGDRPHIAPDPLRRAVYLAEMERRMTNSEIPFTPDWTSPPGDTIADVLASRGLSISHLAVGLRLSAEQAAELIAGIFPLTAEIAERLSSYLGCTVDFWITREAQYRADLVRLGREPGTQRGY